MCKIYFKEQDERNNLATGTHHLHLYQNTLAFAVNTEPYTYLPLGASFSATFVDQTGRRDITDDKSHTDDDRDNNSKCGSHNQTDAEGV